MHDPSKAVFRSAVLPGWGQVYNHKVWKAPIVYGMLGVLGQQVVSNRSNYRHYLKVYRYFRDPLGTEVSTKEYATYLRLQRTGNGMAYADALQYNYQRNMQLSVLGVVGIWGIQVVDAYIDAKMIHSYSMGTDLSFNLSPGVINTADQYAISTASVTSDQSQIELLMSICGRICMATLTAHLHSIAYLCRYHDATSPGTI